MEDGNRCEGLEDAGYTSEVDCQDVGDERHDRFKNNLEQSECKLTSSQIRLSLQGDDVVVVLP